MSHASAFVILDTTAQKHTCVKYAWIGRNMAMDSNLTTGKCIADCCFLCGRRTSCKINAAMCYQILQSHIYDIITEAT